MNETYELIRLDELEPGDVIYLMGGRQEVTEPLWHPQEMKPGLLRVPMRRMDGTGGISPPFERDMMVPCRVTPSRKRQHGRPGIPDLAVQDNSLIGLDLDLLLASLRQMIGDGELIEPGLVRQLDSAMSRGFLPAPTAWRTASYRHLRHLVSRVSHDLSATQATVRRLGEDLAEREKQDGEPQS